MNTKLDPTLERLIRKAYASGFGNIHEYSASQMRQYLSHPKLTVEAVSFKDFKTDEGINLRCYTPSNSANLLYPAVIYLSANAFVLDRIDASNDYCSLLATTLNMKVINIAHRLAPEHKFPQFLYDCVNSIEWIYQHAITMNIDCEKIALWGESSGGSIAASATHILRDQNKPIIKHQILFYPMVSLVTPFPSKETYGYGYMLDKAFIAWLDSRGFTPEQDRSHPLASPLLSPNFSNLPSATVITAGFDPLRDEGEAYGQKLFNANVPVISKRFDDMIHGFMRFYNKVEAANAALRFAAAALGSSFCWGHLRG